MSRLENLYALMRRDSMGSEQSDASSFRDPLEFAKNDIQYSEGLNVLKRIFYLGEINGRKRTRINRTLIIATGVLERSEGWNDYVGKSQFVGDYGEVRVDRHTAFHREDTGAHVVEVLIFDNKLHAQSVCENLEERAKAVLEPVDA